MPGDETAAVESSMSTTGSSVPGDSIPPATPSPQLHDLPVRKPRLPWMLIIVIILVGAVSGLVAAWIGVSRPACFIGAGLLMPLLIMVSAQIGEQAMRRRLRSAAEDNKRDPMLAISEAVARQAFWPSRSSPLSEMAKLLVRRGRLGETVRMQRKGEFAPVQPLTVVFEPRLLDESDSAFAELEAATTCQPAAAGGASLAAPIDRDDSTMLRHVKRNLKLRGGWAFVVMFATFLLRSAWESYQRGAITWELPFWAAMTLLFLIGPDRGVLSGRAQWLLAPGGLLVRKAVRRSTRSQLHLFDRRRSVLCMSQHRQKRWLVVVADTEACELTLTTDREADFLLRAWLSPLQPPPPDRLTDFT